MNLPFCRFRQCDGSTVFANGHATHHDSLFSPVVLRFEQRGEFEAEIAICSLKFTVFKK